MSAGVVSVNAYTKQISDTLDIIHIEEFRPSKIRSSRDIWELQDLYSEDIDIDSMLVLEASIYIRSSVSPWANLGSLFWVFPYDDENENPYEFHKRFSVIVVTDRGGNGLYCTCFPEDLPRVMKEFEGRVCLGIYVDREVFSVAERRYAERLERNKKKGSDNASSL